jgi:hypothetical protein
VPKANETQVGGTHYQTDGELQHWDIVQLFNLDYFQGQVSKYLFRWKYKHQTPAQRLEDLKKARHFLDKYIELNEVRVGVQAVSVRDNTPNPFWKNDPIRNMVACADCNTIHRVGECLTHPGHGYVNQDQC